MGKSKLNKLSRNQKNFVKKMHTFSKEARTKMKWQLKIDTDGTHCTQNWINLAAPYNEWKNNVWLKITCR